MLRASFLAAAWLAAAPAFADCGSFKWSVAKEQALLAAPAASLPATGGVAEPGKGYTVALAKDVKLTVASERTAKPDTFAGMVDLPSLKAGAYQITLSQDAWIDVVADGALVKSLDFSGQKDCPGVRKSVRFQFAGPVRIEFSNATVGSLAFAVSRSD